MPLTASGDGRWSKAAGSRPGERIARDCARGAYGAEGAWHATDCAVCVAARDEAMNADWAVQGGVADVRHQCIGMKCSCYCRVGSSRSA